LCSVNQCNANWHGELEREIRIAHTLALFPSEFPRVNEQFDGLSPQRNPVLLRLMLQRDLLDRGRNAMRRIPFSHRPLHAATPQPTTTAIAAQTSACRPTMNGAVKPSPNTVLAKQSHPVLDHQSIPLVVVLRY
jgi:hypothetical protein